MRYLVNIMVGAVLSIGALSLSACNDTATSERTATFSAATPLVSPLVSWNDTAVKSRIVDFVTSVSDKNNPNYVAPDARVAVFDNDGTLWSERPMAFQLLYSVDRFKDMAAKDPSLANSDALKALLADDMKGFMAGGINAFGALLGPTQMSNSPDEFKAQAEKWVFTAKHPMKNRPYAELHYAPMMELLDYLRDHDFEVYIVSGGGVTFMRSFAPKVYGIPPQNIIGSQVTMAYTDVEETKGLMRSPGLLINNDKAEKPVSIERFIGKRPIMAVGNSDGDFEMLEWTTSQTGPSLGLLVHHTDAEREFAYDRDVAMGALKRGLDEFEARGWSLIDMKNDWSRVYPD